MRACTGSGATTGGGLARHLVGRAVGMSLDRRRQVGHLQQTLARRTRHSGDTGMRLASFPPLLLADEMVDGDQWIVSVQGLGDGGDDLGRRIGQAITANGRASALVEIEGGETSASLVGAMPSLVADGVAKGVLILVRIQYLVELIGDEVGRSKVETGHALDNLGIQRSSERFTYRQVIFDGRAKPLAHPRMGHDLVETRSLSRVGDQHARDEILTFCSDVVSFQILFFWGGGLFRDGIHPRA